MGRLDFVLCALWVLRLCDPSKNIKSPKKSSSFDTCGTPGALFVQKIWPEIQKNTEIQNYKKNDQRNSRGTLQQKETKNAKQMKYIEEIKVIEDIAVIEKEN